jgi:hypothetical protein
LHGSLLAAKEIFRGRHLPDFVSAQQMLRSLLGETRSQQSRRQKSKKTESQTLHE